VREGRVRELMADRREYRIETAGPVPDRLAAQFRQDGMEVSEHAIALSADDPGPVQPVIDALRAQGVVIRAVVEKSLTLEELFLEAVEDAEERGGAA
jgi:hypothetical protein